MHQVNEVKVEERVDETAPSKPENLEDSEKEEGEEPEDQVIKKECATLVGRNCSLSSACSSISSDTNSSVVGAVVIIIYPFYYSP